MANRGHEQTRNCEVAPPSGARRLWVRRECAFAGWTRRATERLNSDLGGELPGLHGVGDALAVERVDHATCVTDEQHAAVVLRCAVEAHRQRTAADRCRRV